MKSTSLVITLFATSVAFGAAAQTGNTQQSAPSRAQGVTQSPSAQTQAGRDMRASQLIGKNIRNPQNQSLGEIKDLVVDSTNGNVRYAVISYGGFLGLGDKLFAFPINQFRLAGNNDLVLDVPQERLRQAPGFARDKWPDWSNAETRGEVDRFYNNRTASGANARYVRMSELLDADVHAPDGKDIGDVEDVVVDVPGGQVRFAVVEFDRAWNANDKLVALPMRAFRPSKDGGDLVLTVERQRLESAPAFDRKQWPDTAASGLRGTIDRWSSNLGFGPVYGGPASRERQAIQR